MRAADVPAFDVSAYACSVSMKYTFGTFLIARPDAITHVRSVDDLLELTEAGDATEGIPEIEKLDQLNLISTGSNENLFTPVPINS